jgi:hypothetical protein
MNLLKYVINVGPTLAAFFFWRGALYFRREWDIDISNFL